MIHQLCNKIVYGRFKIKTQLSYFATSGGDPTLNVGYEVSKTISYIIRRQGESKICFVFSLIDIIF